MCSRGCVKSPPRPEGARRRDHATHPTDISGLLYYCTKWRCEKVWHQKRKYILGSLLVRDLHRKHDSRFPFWSALSLSLSLSLSLRGVKSDCAKLPTHGRLPLPLPPWAVKVRTNRKFIPKDLHECFARRREGMAFQISVRLIKPPLLRGYSKSIRYRLILSRFYAEKWEHSRPPYHLKNHIILRVNIFDRA